MVVRGEFSQVVALPPAGCVATSTSREGFGVAIDQQIVLSILTPIDKELVAISHAPVCMGLVLRAVEVAISTELNLK